ncbi:MAG: hypothetical protein MMC33_004222 [Icmadophila ericetorum]|nr:hypothetical protein [Icmadophila ericetorum]
MTSIKTPNDLDTFDKLYTHLLTLPPPLLPPGHSYNPKLTSTVASLELHPTLEAALHLLNHDLPSAHFLVRHMQAPPAYEGMLLHGILHRIEGDYDNARAWCRDVAKCGDDGVFHKVWKSKEQALEFIDKVERLKKRKEGSKEGLEGESKRELEAVVEFCVERFGVGRVGDAREAWKQPEEDERKKVGQNMIVGGEGWREF